MLIDSFLFFQELELLKIRLEYLYPFVDKFLIIEARQSFQGSIKDYFFEKNIERFNSYIDKIEYYKIEDIHFSYEELLDFLTSSDEKVNKKIKEFITNHSYYDKNNLSHILDTYHRECIHKALAINCRDKDIVVMSDLDEIPYYLKIKELKKKGNLDEFLVCVQHEFQYYLNNYSNNNWYGSIIGPYKLFKNNSLNILRKNSKKFNKISNCGYHFTSIGNEKTIIKKIESWGHQEFNHKIIKKNLQENLVHGKDIFYRFRIKKNKLINLEDNTLIDSRMTSIIFRFDNLILKELNNNLFFNIKYFCYQYIFLASRIIKNPNKFLRKLFILLLKK